MREGFVALSSVLRGEDAPRIATTVAVVAAVPPAEPSPFASVAADLVRLRLAARDAFERAIVRALEGFARDVLGRELSLAPADIEGLAMRAMSDFAECEPIGLAVSPGDAASLEGFPFPFRIDRELERGDVVVDVTGGAFESTRSFRFERVLDASFASACDERLGA